MRYLAYVNDIFNRSIETETVDKPLTVREACNLMSIDETLYPTICMSGGEPILQKDWDTTIINDEDVITFIKLPASKSVLGIALSVVFAIATWYAGSLGGAAAAEAMGYAAGSTGEAVVQGMLAVAVSVGGSVIINLVTAPSPPHMESGGQNSVYNMSYSSNSVRLTEPIPVIYGRHKTYPDYASKPYRKYSGNDEYTYLFFCIGQGKYEVESIYLGDTNINHIGDATYEVIPPGGTNTLFPTVVYTSSAFNGQELHQNQWIGPGVVNPPSTTVTALEVDITFPGGLFKISSKGKRKSERVIYRVEGRRIDSNGNAISNWTVLGNHNHKLKESHTLRFTHHYSVSSGRWEIRIIRTDEEHNDERHIESCRIESARGFNYAHPDYGNVTTLAIKFKASQKLSTESTRRISCIVKRILPVYDKNTGTWVEQHTRNPVWAITDVIKASYGANLSDDYLDLDTLYDVANELDTRRDYFDTVISSTQAVSSAITQIAKAGRCIVFPFLGVLTMVRDKFQESLTAKFTPDTMWKDSFRLNYLIPTDDTADVVKVKYFDNEDWIWKDVECRLPNSTNEKPATITLPGITDRAHAHREGLYYSACNKYRRIVASFDTELEGYIPLLGDLIKISHDMPGWELSGRCVSYDTSSRILKVNEDLDWTGTTHFVVLNDKYGEPSKIIEVEEISINEMRLAEDPGIEIYTGVEREPTLFIFGRDHNYNRNFRITHIKPVASNRITIIAVNEDNRVHEADGTVNVPDDYKPFPIADDTYLRPGPIEHLWVTQAGTPTHPQLNLTWTPSKGAERYVISWSESAQNLVRMSERLGTAPWHTQGVILEGTALGPQGDNTLCSLMSGFNKVEQSITIGSYNKPYSFSAYIRRGSKDNIEMYVSDGVNKLSSIRGNFDTLDVIGNGELVEIVNGLYRMYLYWYNDTGISTITVGFEEC